MQINFWNAKSDCVELLFTHNVYTIIQNVFEVWRK